MYVNTGAAQFYYAFSGPQAVGERRADDVSCLRCC